ncbi:hypothetical protein B0H16DRAFT_1890609 [Mycena metata]|uniref:Ubiquitin-like domain-containing protein n=1 Tax=Mycena metata TaxID=1033252 RepID=A0AAD7IFU2_9AGAR|nr:hypothetical protein B0H16DRAFT_1890609 [Mycena metata]
MPVFTLAYGSFGDIVSTAQLVVKIVQLLRRGGPPSGAWTETETELKALVSELTHLTLHQAPDPFVSQRIQQEVSRCHLVMTRFFTKINASQGLVQKIVWAVTEEKELVAFRAQVIERRTVLSVLVGLLNSGALEAVRDRVSAVAEVVGGQIETVGGQVEAVAGQVATVSAEIGHGKALIRHVHEDLAQQFETYQKQILAVITHVPHGLAEETFIVISPIGVPIPISLVYCTSFEVLDLLLKTYMCGKRDAGSRYVDRGDYSLISSSGEVSPPSQLISTIKGSVCLEMSIVKRVSDASLLEKCPHCGHACENLEATDAGWIACQACSGKFQALTGNDSKLDETAFSTLVDERPAGSAPFRRVQIAVQPSPPKKIPFPVEPTPVWSGGGW